MKPLIGITPDTHHQTTCPGPSCCIPTRSRQEKMILLGDRYLAAVLDHGGLPVLLPVTEDPKVLRETADRLDGLLLAGGAFDVPPEFYGERPRPGLGRLKPERSRFERALLLEAMKRDLPVLGICGGMQILNVVFGGTLYQDLKRERPGCRDHEQKIPKTRPFHPVTVSRGSRLQRILAQTRLLVNSTHHQAVKNLGPGLRASATAPDGVIEAVESESHRFLIGVQWHPEVLYPRQPAQARVFQAFLRAAGEKR